MSRAFNSRYRLLLPVLPALIAGAYACRGREDPAKTQAAGAVAVLTRAATSTAAWVPGKSYSVGNLVTHQDVTYQCRQGHTSQVGWEPPKVPALWMRPTPTGISIWATQTNYVVNSTVTFEGSLYQCITGHVSQVDWSPPATATLWRCASRSCGGGGCAGLPDGRVCDDGSSATLGESCKAGVCQGGSPVAILRCDGDLGSPTCAETVVSAAGTSKPGQGDTVRSDLAALGTRPDVAKTLCTALENSWQQDSARALVTMAMIGEMRNGEAETCLTRFVRKPWPTSGTCIVDLEGDDPGQLPDCQTVEKLALGRLQARAVLGLAFMHTSTADSVVLDIIGTHPDQHVRIEGVSSYLWNKNNSSAARTAVSARLPSSDKIFMDHVIKAPDDDDVAINAKINAYLAAHPAETAFPTPQEIPCDDAGSDACNPKPPSPDGGNNAPGNVCPEGKVSDGNGDCIVLIQ